MGPAQRGEAYGDWASDNQQPSSPGGCWKRTVLFHSDQHETLEELQATVAAREEKLQLQAQNIEHQGEQPEKTPVGMTRARPEAAGTVMPRALGALQKQQQEEEAEAEYFCQAAGDEPDQDVLLTLAKARQPTASPPPPGWKQPVKDESRMRLGRPRS